MTGAAAAEPVDAAATWRRSVAGGAAAFAWVALAALAIGLLEWLGTGRPFGLRLTWKLGGLYLAAFHGAGIRLSSAPSSAGIPTDGIGFLGPEVVLHVTLLVGTAFAAGMLWRAGRRVARGAAGGWIRRIAWGASVAPSYALPVWAVSLLVVLRFPTANVTEVRAVAWQALLGALAVAALAGGAGGGAAAAEASPPPGPWGVRAVAWIAGGWRMTVALVVLAFAGFLVAAGVRSDVSAAYVRGVSGAGAPGAVAAGHHVLLLVNQSFLVAAPAMGGCVAIDGSGSQPTTLCLRSLTVLPGFGSTFLPELSSRTVTPSPVWLLFLLVPLVATTWGGRAAGAGTTRVRERILRGAGAGVVFATFVVIGEAVSAIGVERSPNGDLVHLGTGLLETGALALAWGVAGGAVGALTAPGRQGPVGAPPPAVAEPD